MLYKKRCIGCGKEFPRYAKKKGWKVVLIGRRGKGRRWYRNCGCLSEEIFCGMWKYLFNRNVNYTEDIERKYLGSE